MKRLLAAGATAIFQICKSFRSGERGAWHNPEFTMLEWYETQVDYSQGQQRLLELISVCFPHEHCQLLTYRSLFHEVCVIDPFSASHGELEAAVARFVPDAQTNVTGIDRDGLLNLLMGSVVEEYLRQHDNVVVIDWPASQAALSQTRQTEYGEVGERFEWYHRGVELANGYHELLDPAILRQRNLAVNQLRRAQGDRELPVESRLLQAMEAGLPVSCGCALGVDRLVACLLGASSIDQVIAFPWERA
jgi:lysyl-tRNA synthetase class 2